MTLPVKLTDLLTPSVHTTVDKFFFDKKFSAVFSGLDSLDKRMSVYDTQVANLVALGLERLNDALGPMLSQVQEASRLGFLQCASVGTNISLVEGEAEGFHVTEGASLFAPTPELTVIDRNDTTNWGVVTLDEGGWTPETGDLATHCIFASKTQTSNDWLISASAGVFPAMLNTLTAAVAARDESVAAQTSIAADIITLNALIAAVASGPVASVAGRTGIVTLNISDIIGLVTALANKVESTVYTLGLAGKQATSTKLDALIAATWAANKLFMTTGAGTLTMLDVSTAVQSLLNSASAAAFLSALGGATSASVPTKATAGEVSTGTDDAKFVTALTAAGVYLPRNLGFNFQTGTTYTLDPVTDNGKTVVLTNASPITLTVPNTLLAGFSCGFEQGGAGVVTVAQGSGASRVGRGSRFRTNGQNAVGAIYCRTGTGANAVCTVAGDLIV